MEAMVLGAAAQKALKLHKEREASRARSQQLRKQREWRKSVREFCELANEFSIVEATEVDPVAGVKVADKAVEVFMEMRRVVDIDKKLNALERELVGEVPAEPSKKDIELEMELAMKGTIEAVLADIDPIDAARELTMARLTGRKANLNRMWLAWGVKS